MRSSTRLGFYIPSLTGGGAQRVTVNLANGFIERGTAVDLVVSYRTGDMIEDVNDEVSIINLQTPKIPVVGTAASVPALTRYLRRKTPDVLFSQMHYANVVSVVSHRLTARDTALVLTEHTVFGEGDSTKDKLMFALARQLHPLADHVLAVSTGVAESIRNEVEISSERLSVVNNPIVTPAVHERATARVGHPWLRSTDVDVVLGVGRLMPEKDFTTLVEAVALARERNPSLHLIVLGKGPRRQTLQQRAMELGINDCVSLPGYVDNPYSYMRQADVFALSSRREGLPTALVEAMACGCPVVATDCRSGPREILLDGRFGPLVPVGDPEALANGIERILRAPTPPAVLKERAKDFSIGKVLDEYERLVDQL